MILLRLIFILTVLTLVLSWALYVFTRDRRYLQFAWQVVRFVFFLLILLGLLFVLERYVLVGWGILL
jgi:hypothetical protein